MPHKRNRKSNGGGWSDKGMIIPGYLAHNMYSGAGKDCPGTHVPDGYIHGYTSRGIPGLSGGSRRNRRIRGGTVLNVAAMDSFEPAGGQAPNITMSAPGVPPPSGVHMPNSPPLQQQMQPQQMQQMQPQQMQQMQQMQQPPQKGGRYTTELGSPFNQQGIGMSSYAPIRNISCANSYPTPRSMHGGYALSSAPYVSGSSQYSAANFPQVNVGAPDSMRYNAPTAGYSNTMVPNGTAGGLMLQTGYNAKEMNPACITTGGKRGKRRTTKKRQQGGVFPVAQYAASYSPVKMSEIGSNADFDGTSRGLPVKFGGSRHKHSSRCKHRKQRTQRKQRKHRKQ